MTEEQGDVFDNKPIVDTIMLMRIYDVLWANLAVLDRDAAARLRAVHERGGILMPEVAYDPDWNKE